MSEMAWWCRDCEDYAETFKTRLSGEHFCRKCETPCVLTPDVNPLRSRIAQLEAALTEFRAGNEERLSALAIAARDLEARYAESQARVAELEAKDIESDWLDMSRCIREQRGRIAQLEAERDAQAKVIQHADSLTMLHRATRMAGQPVPALNLYDAAKAELERVKG